MASTYTVTICVQHGNTIKVNNIHNLGQRAL